MFTYQKTYAFHILNRYASKENYLHKHLKYFISSELNSE